MVRSRRRQRWSSWEKQGRSEAEDILQRVGEVDKVVFLISVIVVQFCNGGGTGHGSTSADEEDGLFRSHGQTLPYHVLKLSNCEGLGNQVLCLLEGGFTGTPRFHHNGNVVRVLVSDVCILPSSPTGGMGLPESGHVTFLSYRLPKSFNL